jgi:hypothetical protein
MATHPRISEETSEIYWDPTVTTAVEKIAAAERGKVAASVYQSSVD